MHHSSLLWDASLEGEVCTCPKSYSIYIVERFLAFKFEA